MFEVRGADVKAPEGYVKLSVGATCKCPCGWREADGSNWCCNGTAKPNSAETRTIRDPFLGKDVEISDKLTDRLRGRYAVGSMLPNGEPEFGWRQHEAVPIAIEAAAEIDRLQIEITNYQITLTEARKIIRPFAIRAGYGNGTIAEATTAAATFLNKIGWGKE